MAIIGTLGNGTISQSQGSSSGYNISNNYNNSIGGTFGTGATASALSHQMMQEANEFNARQAEINRKWQENMSNTAYQRAMTDLRKAGLNPILAYTNGGAGTPTGATANSAMGQAFTDIYNESHGEGTSEGKNSSWENSFMTSDIANQIGAIVGMATDAIDRIFGKDTASTTAEQVSEALNGKYKPMQYELGENLGKKFKNFLLDTFTGSTHGGKYDKNGYLIKYDNGGIRYEKGKKK